MQFITFIPLLLKYLPLCWQIITKQKRHCQTANRPDLCWARLKFCRTKPVLEILFNMGVRPCQGETETAEIIISQNQFAYIATVLKVTSVHVQPSCTFKPNLMYDQNFKYTFKECIYQNFKDPCLALHSRINTVQLIESFPCSQ